MEPFLIAFATSLLAGFINSVAGGGTLITFPSLIWLGVDPVVANMTNTVALWTGSLTGTLGFRNRLAQVKSVMIPFILASLLGSISGAFLLLKTPSDAFRAIVPFLIFLAVFLLYFSEFIRRVVDRFAASHRGIPRFLPLTTQFLTGVYGSYFGAGIGIMMLASLTLSGLRDIHTANALKNLMGFLINLLGAIFFILSGKVSWSYALSMMPGFALGGYLGASFSQRLSSEKVRVFVSVWGLGIGIYLLLLK